MNTDEVVSHVIKSLNAQGVSYMIVGSLATNFYCVPRSTQDGDFVVQSSLGKVAREISRSHGGLRFDPQLGLESVTATKKIVLRTEEHDFEIELFELSADEHDQQRFTRRIQVELLGQTAWIATIEDMIVTKLRWAEHAGREKDIADVRNLIAVQQNVVDWPYVETWCDRHDTRPLLERLRGECKRS
jgi:predicted nucleotidyltransferase